MANAGGDSPTQIDAVRSSLDASPMSPAQMAAVVLAVTLSALDGYDVLSVTFAAPAISKDWGVGKDALGFLLSSGLIGMAIGSLFLAPLADIIGRRTLVLACVCFMGAGMLLSSVAESLPQLALWRVVTGVGIGACVALIVSIASEFSNARWRAFALSAVAMGYPAGGVAGGLFAAWLLGISTWHAVFLAGFVLAAALLPVVLLVLPESPGFLLTRRQPDALRRLNSVLRRCRQPEVAALPAANRQARSGYAAVFAGAQLGSTVRITVINLLMVFTTYYVLSWLPQMVADAGFPPSAASLVSSAANLAGIVGGLLLGAFARRAGADTLTIIGMFGVALSTTAFGYSPPVFTALVSAAAICGFFLFAVAAGMYGAMARSFPDHARASGSGFAFGVGRVGSACAPIIAGWLFASGLGRAETSAAFGACAALAALLMLASRPRSRRNEQEPAALNSEM